jgi:hypothetical protein
VSVLLVEEINIYQHILTQSTVSKLEWSMSFKLWGPGSKLNKLRDDVWLQEYLFYIPIELCFHH